MIPKSKRAVAPTTTRKKSQPEEPYTIATRLSSARLKDQLGTLLLHLQGPLRPDERQTCWRVFEAALRRYIDLKVRRRL